MERGADKDTQMRELADLASGCTRCGLSNTRTQVVFGQGRADAGVVFVGEGPGAEEDRQGQPFVGAAGRLLNTLLEEISLDRAEVYITSIVKCRPPGNRDPQPNEIEACHEYLVAQIAVMQPLVVCTLGRWAARTLLGRPDFKISREHGRTVRWNGMMVMPVFHPAAVLHQARFMEPLREDFRLLEQLLKSNHLL